MKTIRVEYYAYVGLERRKEFSHAYEEKWEPSALHCVSCGAKTVWEKLKSPYSEDDTECVCTSCGNGFSVQDIGDNEQEKQRVQQLKESP